MNGLVRRVRRVALAAVWLVIAALVALGAAGIVGAMAHLPGTPSRAELTYAGDQAIEPGLDAAEASLIELAGQVRQLSELGRDALTALVGRDIETLATTVSDGETLAATIQRQADEIRVKLDGLPGVGPGDELILSADTRARYSRALQALAPTDGLAAAWSRLAVGSVAATRITGLLTDHDLTTADAAALGRTGKYAEALERLAESDRMIFDARNLRDTLAATVDVTTLGQWLDLNAEYDAALRHLYQAILDSKGKVTADVKAAYDAEAAARKRLPADTKALVIIIAEIGRGGLNQAVIAIEEARGELDAALGSLGGIPDESPAAP
jgi:tetratricopeptide (TPR) repeat protein